MPGGAGSVAAVEQDAGKRETEGAAKKPGGREDGVANRHNRKRAVRNRAMRLLKSMGEETKARHRRLYNRGSKSKTTEEVTSTDTMKNMQLSP